MRKIFKCKPTILYSILASGNLHVSHLHLFVIWNQLENMQFKLHKTKPVTVTSQSNAKNGLLHRRVRTPYDFVTCFATFFLMCPQKLSGGMLASLCVWVKVQICIWPSWCNCHSLSLAPDRQTHTLRQDMRRNSQHLPHLALLHAVHAMRVNDSYRSVVAG